MRLNKKQKQLLKKTAHSIHPIVTIGKHGLSEQVLKMINAEVAVHELLKIKILDSEVISTKEAASQICEHCKADLVDLVGKTIVIFKENLQNLENDIKADGRNIERKKLAKLK